MHMMQASLNMHNVNMFFDVSCPMISSYSPGVSPRDFLWHLALQTLELGTAHFKGAHFRSGFGL